MENNGVVVAEEGRCEFSHGNGVLEVGSAQKWEIKEDQGEREGTSGLMVCLSVDEGNKEDFEDGKAAIDSIEEAEKMKKKRSRPITNEEEGKKKRGRPKKTEESGDKMRRMPKKNKEGGQKTRGRPKKNKVEGENLEVMKNNEVKHVNGEFVGSGELAGEDKAKDVKLECIKVEKPVQENKIAEKELGEENNGRSDEGENGKNSSGTRILGQRKSKTNAKLNMAKIRLEDEELSDAMKKFKKGGHPRKGAEKGVGYEENSGDSEMNKRKGVGENRKRGRKPSKGLEKQEENVDEKEVTFEENGCKSEVDKRDGDGENKKRRGRKPKGYTQKDKVDEKEAEFEESRIECKANKMDGDGENKQQGTNPSKDFRKQEDNGEESGECVDEKDKEWEGVDKKKIGKRVSKCKGEEGEGEVQKEGGQNHSRSLRSRTRKVNTEEACKPKRLADENVRFLGNVKIN